MRDLDDHIAPDEVMAIFGLISARFAHVFLLEIDEITMLSRLDPAGRDNDFGRIGDTRERLRRWLPGYQLGMRAFGGIPIAPAQHPDTFADYRPGHPRAPQRLPHHG